jgi:hypothetical protein
VGVFVYQPAEQIAASDVELDGGAGGGSDLSGAAWLSARCGRWSLKCATYGANTVVRWRRLMIRVRSSSSRRTVATDQHGRPNSRTPHTNLYDGGRAVRDSKDPAGPVLTVTRGGLDSFTAGVRAGEFD